MVFYTRFPNDALPQVPQLPIKVINPINNRNMEFNAIIDTGADCSVIPYSLIVELGLRCKTGQAKDYANKTSRIQKTQVNITIRCGVTYDNLEVFCAGDEAIIGRDILNNHKLILNPPEPVHGTLCRQPSSSCEECG